MYLFFIYIISVFASVSLNKNLGDREAKISHGESRTTYTLSTNYRISKVSKLQHLATDSERLYVKITRSEKETEVLNRTNFREFTKQHI